MTLHLKSRGYPFRPRLLFSSFIVVGVGSPNCVLFQERTESFWKTYMFDKSAVAAVSLATRSDLSDAYPGAPTGQRGLGDWRLWIYNKKAPTRLYEESVRGLTLYLGAIKALFNLI